MPGLLSVDLANELAQTEGPGVGAECDFATLVKLEVGRAPVRQHVLEPVEMP
ncbi:MAG: hypothetical protein ACREF4_08070 [Gammaproteobacteria bacterium]